MAVKKDLIFVRILGQGIYENFRAVSHEVIGYPAGTYHVFEMESGARLYFNDFGVRTVTVAKTLAGLD